MFSRQNSYDWSDLGCLAWLGIIVLLIGLVWFEVQVACWLWGVIMVGIFALPALTGWQMFGLMILAGLILPSGGYRSSK